MLIKVMAQLDIRNLPRWLGAVCGAREKY